MDYQKQAEDFLAKHSLTFSAVLIGSDCPRFCEDAKNNKNMDKINAFPRKSHIHGKHYRCSIERRVKMSEANGKPVWDERNRTAPVSFDFWNSYADEEYNVLGCQKYRNGEHSFKYSRKIKDGKWVTDGPKTPTPYSLLACLTKSDPGTFEDFCGDYGYDSDSRKAFDVYLAVQEEYRKITRFFTAEELEELQEIS